MALVLALGVLVVLSATTVAVVEYTTANSRNTKLSGGRDQSSRLAEAGINNSMAVLSEPTNNALLQSTLPRCTGNAQANWNHNTYEGGSVDWCGDLIATEAAWQLTSIGTVVNPHGGQSTTRKLGAYVTVVPTVTQPLNTPAWNYLFNKSTALTCDMTLSNNVGGSSRLYVAGDLCLSNNAAVTSAELIVHGSLSLGNNAYVGASTSMSTRVPTHVGGNCKYGTGAWTSPNCGGNQDSRNIFSKIVPGDTIGVSTSPPVIGAPTSDFATWYANAIPGPAQACSTSSGTPPTFDNDTTRNNSVSTVFDLTGTSSYTCRNGPAGSPSGEISWNASTKVLTVSGTIYIDGSLQSSGSVNQYNGQATIYLSGTFSMTNNSKLCGGISGSNCDFASWNPNTEMLTITTEGTGGLAGAGNGIYLDNNSQFQGALYAAGNITYTNNSRSDGPMVANQLIFANNVQNDSFPTITVVPAGMPGNPAVYAQPNAPKNYSG